jgi:hypothetical protein
VSRARRQGEGGLSDAIREALAYEPGLMLCRNSTGLFRARGCVVRAGLGNGSADLIGVLNGRFVALEVKRPGEKPEPHQVAWLDAITRHGGFACVVHSVDEARAAIARARKDRPRVDTHPTQVKLRWEAV